MKFSYWLVVIMGLLIGVGCAVAPTPTPSPVPTPVPSPAIGVATPNGMLITSVANRRAPADVPACPNAQVLPQAIELTWTGTEDVRHNAPDSNWTYYRCGGPRANVVAFYRRWISEQPYDWVQMYWEERTDATMGAFYRIGAGLTEPNRWLYLWVLSDTSASQNSDLVAAWWEAPKSC